MILVPPTTLRITKVPFPFDYGSRADAYIREEWEAQYVLGGLRPVVIRDEVFVGEILVEMAVYLGLSLIEVSSV